MAAPLTTDEQANFNALPTLESQFIWLAANLETKQATALAARPGSITERITLVPTYRAKTLDLTAQFELDNAAPEQTLFAAVVPYINN